MSAENPSIDAKRVNKAIGYACRILSMREYSEKAIYQKILTKGYESSEVDLVIGFLLDNNWLSNQRFCEVFVRSKISRGQGLSRIRFELNEQGINNELLNSVLNSQEPINWQNVCDKVAERKIESSCLQNTIKDRQKMQRFLMYRGFSGEQIRNSVNKYINRNEVGVKPGEHDE